jgi:hypothetical protein
MSSSAIDLAAQAALRSVVSSVSEPPVGLLGPAESVRRPRRRYLLRAGSHDGSSIDHRIAIMGR